MALRSSESRFPEGLTAADLGYASRPEIVGATQFQLIAFQPAGIAPHATPGKTGSQDYKYDCAYALFATPLKNPPSGAAPAEFDEIRWRVVSRLDHTQFGADKIVKATAAQPASGFFQYACSRPALSALQDFKVVADLYLRKNRLVSVAIAQGVHPPYYALESLYASTTVAGGENNVASRPVGIYLGGFIQETAKASGCPADWLAGLLYQRVYANVADRLRFSADNEDKDLSAGLQNNNLPPKLLWKPLGVAQLPLPLAALALGLIDFKPPADVLYAQGLTDPLLTQWNDQFRLLAPTVKQDLFNRLRFPKPCLVIAAALAKLLKEKRYAGLNWEHAELRRHLLADVANLAAEKPALSPKPATLDEKGFKEAAQKLGGGLGFAAKVEALLKGDFIKRFFTPPPGGATPPPEPPRYGGYPLQRDDADALGRYAGVVQALDKTPRLGTEQFVEALQADLRTLGFRHVDHDPKGVFGMHTEWALRDFQGYAKLAAYPNVNVAQETERPAVIPDRLEEDLGGERLKADVRQADIDAAKAVGGATPWHPLRALRLFAKAPNKTATETAPDETFKGAVSGIADEAARQLLERWKAQRYRCPVVLGIWEMSPGGPAVGKPLGVADDAGGNLWHGHAGSDYYRARKQARESSLPVYAYDLSNNYAFPAGRPANGFHPLGRIAWYLDTHGPSTGSWSDACALKPRLIQADYEEVGWSRAQVARFKVIHSVVSVEASSDGGIDPINAYDGAYISLGFYHWTISPFGKPGELDALLARLQQEFPADYGRVYGDWGLGVLQKDKKTLGPWGESGQGYWEPGTRTYVGYPAKRVGPGERDWRAFPKDELDYFRGWHVIYRFAMAIRAVPNFRRMLWLMAEARIQSFLTVEWRDSTDPLKRVVSATAGAQSTLQAIFTAECNVALLLRWHVNMPACIASGKQAAATLIDAFARARQLYESKHQQLLTPPASPDAAFNQAAARYVRLAERATWKANARSEPFFAAAPAGWSADPLQVQTILLDGALFYLKERKERSERQALADERALEALADDQQVALEELLSPPTSDAKAQLKTAADRLDKSKTQITGLKTRAGRASTPEAGQPWRPEAGQRWNPADEQPWKEVEVELRQLDPRLRDSASVLLERLAQAQGLPPPAEAERLPPAPAAGTPYVDLAAQIVDMLDRTLTRLRRLDGAKVAAAQMEDVRALVRDCGRVGNMAERALDRLSDEGPPSRVKDKAKDLLSKIASDSRTGRLLADRKSQFAGRLNDHKTQAAAAAAGATRWQTELGKLDPKLDATQKKLTALTKLKEAQTALQTALDMLKPTAANSAAELSAARAQLAAAGAALTAAKPDLGGAAGGAEVEQLAQRLAEAVDEKTRLQTADGLVGAIKGPAAPLANKGYEYKAYHNLLDTIRRVSLWKKKQHELVERKPLDPALRLDQELTLSTDANSFEAGS